MLKIIDNDIYRGSTKVGYFTGNDIYDEEGLKLGWYEKDAQDIFDSGGRKIAYVDHNELRVADGKKIRLDEIHKHVQGGTISDLARAAIMFLVGD